MRGFTLIELMTVVVVIAVLAAVAVPSYQSSVRKARRADARVALTAAAQMMERYYTERNTYATASFGSAASDVYRGDSENGFYHLTIPSKTINTFTLKADPTGAQALDECGSFTLTSTGVRDVTGGTLTMKDCW